MCYLEAMSTALLSHGLIFLHSSGAVCPGEGGASFISELSRHSCSVKSIFWAYPSPCLMTGRNTSLNVIASSRPINVLEIMELRSIVFLQKPFATAVFTALYFSFLTIMQFRIENRSLLQPCGLRARAGVRCSLVTAGKILKMSSRKTVAKLRNPPWVHRSIPRSAIGKCKILHHLHFNTS